MTGDSETLTLELERTLPASAERVHALLTEPAELARWWGPHGFTIPQIRLDLRVGGGYRFTMQPPEGEAFHLSGEYVDLRPPYRLAFTFRWDEPTPDDRETLVDLTLRPRDGSTLVALRQEGFATQERVELHRAGWSDSFERLEALLRGRSGSGRSLG